MDKEAMKQTVVMYPGMGPVGHLAPMMELANIFLKHGYDVAMVLLEPPIKSSATDVERVATPNPSLSLHILPPICSTNSVGEDPFLLGLRLLRQYNERLESFLRSIVPRQRLHSLVVDSLHVDAVDVAAKLGVPVYTFFSSGAAALAVVTQLPTLCAKRQRGLKELGNTPIEFPGVPPMPASHLIKEAVGHPEDELHKAAMYVWKRIMDTRGVLVNTVESLESRAVEALRCAPGRVLPPVYCVGPLVAAKRNDDGKKGAGRHECLAWLDTQFERSIVFLCFGSMGVFSEEQLREIAVGLEESGQRFLWVVRRPRAAGGSNPVPAKPRLPKLDLEALLPEGFLARTTGRGLVVMSWAPQVDVLQHPATGAFVTHCGWNSTLEAVMAGVPMVCWPLYAEQKMNKVFMTSSPGLGGMGVGVAMDGYQVGFVKAEEVAAKVRLVMESDQGRELRARVAAHRKQAEAALVEGGSSHAAFLRFLSDALRTNLGEQRPSNL